MYKTKPSTKQNRNKHVNVIDLSLSLSLSLSLFVLKIQFFLSYSFHVHSDLVQFFFFIFWSVSTFFEKQTNKPGDIALVLISQQNIFLFFFSFLSMINNHQHCLRVFPSIDLVFGFKKYAHFPSFAFIIFRTVRVCVCVFHHL